MKAENKKYVIYQLLPRLLSNDTKQCVVNGTLEQNGCGKMNHITATALKSIKALGATHVWYTGVIEHANMTDYSQYGIMPDNPYIVKGKAGSPYAIKDYYDIDPDIACDVPNRMAEFSQLVERTHDNGLKVIIDFVPNHVARCYHSDAKPDGESDFGDGDNVNVAFAPDNNFYYIPGQRWMPHIDLGSGEGAYNEYPAKVTGNDCFMASPSEYDWYETVKLNYGVDYSNHTTHFSPIPDTWHKMLHILQYWAAKGVDGFRCDMAHMVPVEFWQWAITQIKEQYPDMIFIAELYDIGIYHRYLDEAKFDFLYDKVNLYDTLRGILTQGWPASSITHCWQTIDGIGNRMLNFLENHDEQRIASHLLLGDGGKARPAAIVSTTMSCAPFLIYAGQELGEHAEGAEGFSGDDGRTTIFDYWSVPTLARWYNGGKYNATRLTPEEKALRQFYKKLLTAASHEKALSEGGFYDLMYVNFDNPHLDTRYIYTYLRHYGNEVILSVANFGDNDTTVGINIPSHALATAAITTGEYTYTDLLTGQKGNIIISDTAQAEVRVEAHNGVLLKLKRVLPKKR